MPALPPPLNVNQAPVVPPVPHNAANPIAAPNQVGDLQAPLIPGAAAAPVVQREFFLKTYFKNVKLAQDQLVKDHPLKFLTLLLQAAIHNVVAYYLAATWFYMQRCGDNYPYVAVDLSANADILDNTRKFNVKMTHTILGLTIAYVGVSIFLYLLIAPCVWVHQASRMRGGAHALKWLDHFKLFVMYLSIPFNLQWVLYVIFGGFGD